MAMVEMVIVLPILLLVLFSIIEFGVAFARWQVVTNAAREGARASAVFNPSCDPDDPADTASAAADVKGVVENFATAVGMDPDDLTITVEGACGGPDTLSTVTVQSTYTFQFLPSLSDGGVGSGLDLVGKSVMRNGG